MIRSLLLSVTVATSLSMAPFATAQTTVATDPVGFTTTQCLANSDTFVSVPFTRPPEFTGAVQSVSGNTLTFAGSPWAANQFVYASGSQPKTYFALIGSGPKEGSYYTLTSNTANTLTLDLEGEDISSVQAGTQILVVPYATLASVFPASDANVSFVPSSNQFNRQTQILIPNYNGTGTNLSTSTTYYFLNGAWRKFGRPATESYNDDPFVNNGYFMVRNGATATSLATPGSVLMKKTTVPLLTRTNTQQDNFVSVIRPVDVKLNDLGLISSGAFAASPNSFNRVDQLFVFDNSAAGINKSASATYYYFNGAWRKFGQATTIDAGSDVIPAGSGFIIRKGATATGATVFWQNAPTYL